MRKTSTITVPDELVGRLHTLSTRYKSTLNGVAAAILDVALSDPEALDGMAADGMFPARKKLGRPAKQRT